MAGTKRKRYGCIQADRGRGREAVTLAVAVAVSEAEIERKREISQRMKRWKRTRRNDRKKGTERRVAAAGPRQDRKEIRKWSKKRKKNEKEKEEAWLPGKL